MSEAEGDYRETVFQTQQGSHTYKFIVDMTTCTRPLKAQAGPNPSTEGSGRYEVPSLGKKLLTMDNFWEKESWFPLRVWALIH